MKNTNHTFIIQTNTKHPNKSKYKNRSITVLGLQPISYRRYNSELTTASASILHI